MLPSTKMARTMLEFRVSPMFGILFMISFANLAFSQIIQQPDWIHRDDVFANYYMDFTDVFILSEVNVSMIEGSWEVDLKDKIKEKGKIEEFFKILGFKEESIKMYLEDPKAGNLDIKVLDKTKYRIALRWNYFNALEHVVLEIGPLGVKDYIANGTAWDGRQYLEKLSNFHEVVTRAATYKGKNYPREEGLGITIIRKIDDEYQYDYWFYIKDDGTMFIKYQNPLKFTPGKFWDGSDRRNFDRKDTVFRISYKRTSENVYWPAS